MSEYTVVHHCSHVGVAGTTPVRVKQLDDGTFAARCGIAMMGVMNMNKAGFEACGHDPFHPEFNDNWCEGRGATEEEALTALKVDMRQMSDSLWQ